jgi:hypothetical protein
MEFDGYYRPALSGPPHELPSPLPDPLRSRLAPRFPEDFSGDVWGPGSPVDGTALDYVAGLADGGVEGAAELAEAIRDHGVVIVNMRAQ